MAQYGDKSYTQQPQATPGMTLSGGNRNAKNLPMDAEGRDWSNGLFECLETPETFIWAWFCPSIIYAQNKQRHEHLNSKGTPDPEHGGELVSNDCLVHAAFRCFGVGWFLQYQERGNVRSRYSIRGEPVTDCATAFCCTPCQLTQETQELELEERSFGGHA